jgi:glycosyltransferase involved in cell wall biosynthesis
VSPAAGVLVVGPLPPPIHGAARVTDQVVGNLRAAGVTVRALDTSGRDSGVGLGHHWARLRVHLRAAGLALLGRRRPSALYVAGAGGLGLWYQVLVVLAARLARIPTMFHHHSYAYVARRTPSMRALVAAGGRRLDHVVLCDGMGAALRTTYPAIERVRICSNAGLFPPAGPPAPREGSVGLVLGHLGNLVVEKGLPLVFDTLRQLRAGGADARLLLGGPVRTGEAAELLSQAQAEFGAALEHLGPIPPAEVDEFYRRIDVFVFPSRYVHEAEPLVVLEASRCGVPTVAYAVGCVGALVAAPGWLVEPGADFAVAAARVAPSATDPGVRQAVVDHFSVRREGALLAHAALVAALTAG